MKMTFKIPFIQADRFQTGTRSVDSCTILKTKKLKKLVEGLLPQYY